MFFLIREAIFVIESIEKLSKVRGEQKKPSLVLKIESLNPFVSNNLCCIFLIIKKTLKLTLG